MVAPPFVQRERQHSFEVRLEHRRSSSDVQHPTMFDKRNSIKQLFVDSLAIGRTESLDRSIDQVLSDDSLDSYDDLCEASTPLGHDAGLDDKPTMRMRSKSIGTSGSKDHLPYDLFAVGGGYDLHESLFGHGKKKRTPEDEEGVVSPYKWLQKVAQAKVKQAKAAPSEPDDHKEHARKMWARVRGAHTMMKFFQQQKALKEAKAAGSWQPPAFDSRDFDSIAETEKAFFQKAASGELDELMIAYNAYLPSYIHGQFAQFAQMMAQQEAEGGAPQAFYPSFEAFMQWQEQRMYGTPPPPQPSSPQPPQPMMGFYGGYPAPPPAAQQAMMQAQAAHQQMMAAASQQPQYMAPPMAPPFAPVPGAPYASPMGSPMVAPQPYYEPPSSPYAEAPQAAPLPQQYFGLPQQYATAPAAAPGSSVPGSPPGKPRGASMSAGSSLVERARSKEGSLALQKEMHSMAPAKLQATIDELAPALPELCTDTFGNYLVSGIVRLPPAQPPIEAALRGRVVELARHAQGSRIFQAALDALPGPTVASLVAELQGHVAEVAFTTNGSWSVVAAFKATHGSHPFLAAEVGAALEQLATVQDGSRVVQRLLVEGAKSGGADVGALLSALVGMGGERLGRIADDQYGNYVVQNALRASKEAGAQWQPALVELLLPCLPKLSTSKAGSNTAEAIIGSLSAAQLPAAKELLLRKSPVPLQPHRFGRHVIAALTRRENALEAA